MFVRNFNRGVKGVKRRPRWDKEEKVLTMPFLAPLHHAGDTSPETGVDFGSFCQREKYKCFCNKPGVVFFLVLCFVVLKKINKEGILSLICGVEYT